MPDITPIELENLLNDLLNSVFTNKRSAAAARLGQLSFSNAEIIRGLAIAQDFDDQVEVRRSAREALLAEVHQAFIKEHPTFVQEVTETAQLEKNKEKSRKEYEIIEKFLRLRSRQRRYFLLFFIILSLGYCLFFLVLPIVADHKWILYLFQAVIILPAFLIFWLSWRHWRCPSCDSWLGGWTFQVNPIWSPDSLRCPQCGVRLK